MSENAKRRNRARTSNKTTSGSFARTPEDVKRDAEALRLRSAGYSYEEIGVQLGCSTSTAFRGIKRAIQDIEAPAVEQYREEMNAQLNYLQNELMELYADTDDETALKTLDRVMKVMERRAKLNGLDAPMKVQAEVSRVEVNVKGWQV